MRKDLTELVFIIDRSGSMRPQTASTIDGFNKLIEEQKKTPGEKIVSVVLFNGRSKEVCLRMPIEEISPLTEEEYFAHGSTALLDAVQTTINHIGNMHIAGGEKDLPEHTIFFITTDGEENSSRHTTVDSLKGSIAYNREKNGLEFVFLAANLDAVSVAENYGIERKNALRHYDDDRGVDLKFKAMNRYIDNVVYKVEDDSWAEDVENDFSSRSGAVKDQNTSG